jgi:DNA-directed RNA polymerase subunit omega
MPNPLIVDEKKLQNLRNRYELIIVASKRSRQLRDGSAPLVKTQSEKEPVIALREVLDGKIVAISVPRHKENNLKNE